MANRKKESGISSKTTAWRSLSHLLFLAGGFLLGLSFASFFIPDEPNIVQAGGGAVVGLCALIIGQQTADHDDDSTPEPSPPPTDG